MKTFALITAVMAAAALGNTCNLGYPGKFKCYNVSFSDLVQFPTKYNNMPICVNGIAASVTNLPTYSEMHMTGEGLPYVITVKGESDMFTYSADCVGSKARAEGIFTVNKDNLYDMKITATAVVLESEGRTICKNWVNNPVVHNMDKGDFYGPGMGSGLVVLEPGQSMHLHSTNHSTEIVTVFDGAIDFVIMRGDVPEVHTLEKHDAILVPHSTPHYVTNTRSVSATYLFVHAEVPVPPPED